MQLSARGAFDGQQSYELSDLGNGRTRIDIDSHYRFAQWFANFMEPLVTPAARKKLDGDVAHLKSAVAGAPKPGS